MPGASLEETKTWLPKAIRRTLITSEIDEIRQIIGVLPKKLTAYAGSIKKAGNADWPSLWPFPVPDTEY